MLVTAYSEFFVSAHEDSVFREILRKADIVTPDGNSVLAAREYLRAVKGKNLLSKIFLGLGVGGKILKSRIGETVTGVWLFDTLTSHAPKDGWKIFLLGGWDGVASRTAKRLLKRFPDIKVEYDEGEKKPCTPLERNVTNRARQ